jgi:amidase
LSTFRVPRGAHRFDFDPRATPALRVPSGSTVVFETLDCFSNQLVSPAQRYAREEDLLAVIGAYNPVTGPVFVEGAAPGDVLAVAIRDVKLGTAGRFAVTTVFGEKSQLVSAPVDGIPPDGDTRICALDGEDVLFPIGTAEVRLPVRPMVGTIGTTPAEGPLRSLHYDHTVGGNLDCPFAGTDAVVYLPVRVPGALLALGDVHAAMGDAEITGTALETSADVTVEITVLQRELGLPHVDDPAWIGVIGCVAGQGVEGNLEAAMVEMHTRLCRDHRMPSVEAYHLLGTVARVRVNQCVAGGWTSVYVGVPRSVLPQGEVHAAAQ